MYIVQSQVMLNLSGEVLQRYFKVVQLQFNTLQRHYKHLSDVLCQQVSVTMISTELVRGARLMSNQILNKK